LPRSRTGSVGLPGPYLLAVLCHDVGLIGVDGVCAGAAFHSVLDGRDIPRLDGVAAAVSVEAVIRGIAALPDQVVRAVVAVDDVLSTPVAELVGTQAALDEVGAVAAVEPVVATEAGDMPDFPVPEMMSVPSVPVIKSS
jgi:hypothetical protein